MFRVDWPLFLFFIFVPVAFGSLEQGIFEYDFHKNDGTFFIPKTMFAGTKIFVQITCDSAKDLNTEVHISWRLRQTSCYRELFVDDSSEHLQKTLSNETFEIRSKDTFDKCVGNNIVLSEFRFGEKEKVDGIAPKEELTKKPLSTNVGKSTNNPVYTVTKDGFYTFRLDIISMTGTDFIAHARIEARATYGYLSASDWPLLPFYGTMCLVYVLYGVIWLLVSFLQWRDLLRIQFWIGGVILLGMLEKAVFYAEYQSVNSTGVSVQGAELLAEWVSCAKRTLARMLVIIVSLGFGIVKPRLGPMLHRVVGTGALYFMLACVEGYLRVMHVKHDQGNETLVAGIPLAVLDSAICWWIFTSLVQTTRTLRLRRNMVKLSLYRHFTNTLIFAVIASVLFMLYMIKVNQLSRCAPAWRDIWIENAFWHVLFSVLFLVIMILWRPTNNNQRYAFTPLLDNPEDEDDEEEDQFVADAYGVKMRGAHQNNMPKGQSPKATTTEEDDLRWVEENIPSSMADSALPVLDSDEEIINTKFEVSKMQ